jgi:hypothetical protein
VSLFELRLSHSSLWTSLEVYRRKKCSFLRLPQSQNKNVNITCFVGNPVCMIREQGGVKFRPEPILCHVDRLFPDHVTGECVRTPPPPSFTWLVA